MIQAQNHVYFSHEPPHIPRVSKVTSLGTHPLDNPHCGKLQYIGSN